MNECGLRVARQVARQLNNELPAAAIIANQLVWSRVLCCLLLVVHCERARRARDKGALARTDLVGYFYQMSSYLMKWLLCYLLIGSESRRRRRILVGYPTFFVYTFSIVAAVALVELCRIESAIATQLELEKAPIGSRAAHWSNQFRARRHCISRLYLVFAKLNASSWSPV